MDSTTKIGVELWVELPEGATLPDDAAIDLAVLRAIGGQSPGGLREELDRRWHNGQLDVVRPKGPLRQPANALRLMASSSLDLARRHRKQVLRVIGEDAPGPERPGLWTTILAAQGLAAVFGGHIVDPARGAVGGLPLEGLVPSDKARVHVGRHICVPAAPGLRGGSWLTTLGCRNFGLPELELHGIEPARVENAARLMAGVAQHLVEGHDPARPFPGTVTLTLGDLQRALGLRVGPSPAGARGWTRVGLQTRRVLDDDRGRLELRAPGNYRGSRRDWIAFALADLLGPPRSRRSNDELSAAE